MKRRIFRFTQHAREFTALKCLNFGGKSTLSTEFIIFYQNNDDDNFHDKNNLIIIIMMVAQMSEQNNCCFGGKGSKICITDYSIISFNNIPVLPSF